MLRSTLLILLPALAAALPLNAQDPQPAEPRAAEPPAAEPPADEPRTIEPEADEPQQEEPPAAADQQPDGPEPPAPRPKEPPVSPLEAVTGFMEQVRTSDRYDDAAKALIEREWQSLDRENDLQTFIPSALAVLHPRFKAGLDAFDAREYSYCGRIMGDLALSSDPYLAAHAALFQAKALIQQTQLQYPLLLLQYYIESESNASRHLPLVDEMTFWLGYCQFHTFEGGAAHETLSNFLEQYPAASPALRASARELLDQLEPPPRKTLGQAAHLMADAGLRLTEGLGDVDTQLEQKKAMLILEDLIAQAQQQEQQQKQQQAGGGSGAPQNASAPSSPAQQSTVPGGQAGMGQQHAAPRAEPGESWGEMRPQERARIMQMLQENFPTRYRDLVEQYFADLAKEE